MRLDVDTVQALKERDMRKAKGASLKAFPCKRYKIYVTNSICEKCKADPEFKQGLFIAFALGKAARRDAPCSQRNGKLERVVYDCCGGRKHAEFDAFACKRFGARKIEPDCWLCEDYIP